MGGTLAALVLLAGLGLWLSTAADDDPAGNLSAGGDPSGPTATVEGEDETEGGNADEKEEAITGGAPVTGATPEEAEAARANGDLIEFGDIEVGDCGDPQLEKIRQGPTIVQDCDTAHQLEVIGLIEHPDAGAEYPGGLALQQYGLIECERIFENRFGVDDVDTSLAANPYVPTEEDWSNNVFTIVCAVGRSDIQPLTEGLGDDVSEWVWMSGDSLSLYELRDGWCFDTPTPIEPSGGQAQRVIFRECSEPHIGEEYWVVLHDEPEFDEAESFPAELIADDADRECHEMLDETYGTNHRDFGIVGTEWVPNEQEWQFGARVSSCVVLFDEPVDRSLADIVAE